MERLLTDILSVFVKVVVLPLAACCVFYVVARMCCSVMSVVKRRLVSATGAALLAFAVGLLPTVAKRAGTTGVSPDAVALDRVESDWESRHLGGGIRSGASNADFWLSRIDPSSNSVELGVAWLPGAFAVPPFIEFTVSTNLSVGAWTLLGWTEAEAGETNLSVEVVASQLPGGAMPPAAFFRAMAYDGLGADDDDDDGDDLTNAEERALGTNPRRADSDGDGLPDGWETAYGMDPLASNTGDPRTDASADPDHDGLTNAQEAALGTDPFQPDSDGDGMDDGWESRHGFDPTTHNDDTARDDDDADADPDNDGLTNAEECAWGTDPSEPDTDNDGVDDSTEIAQGSDPADSTDEGKPNSRIHVTFFFGDHSTSHSEKYQLAIKAIPGSGNGALPRSFAWVNANYGECETRPAALMPGWSYEVRLAHASTNRPQGADYDYTLNAVNVPQSVIVSDPDGLFGVHSSGSTFTGAGLVATIHVLAPPQISAPKVIGVNNDDDNVNGTPDRQDNGTVEGDDDLVEVTISARCPVGMTGTLTVMPLVDVSKMNVWKDRSRTELGMFATTYPVSGPEGVTQTFYIEGDAYSVSYMYERIQASIACGGATSTNEHRFTVVERIAEPITTEREGGQIVNPCCAVIGVPTPMKVQVLPSSFPDNEIKWKVVQGTGTFANGGTGRNVSFTATGSENSETKLQVDVGDCPGRAPQFTLRGTTLHEVKIYPCVIHAEEEASTVDSSSITAMLDDVNVIFRQVGLHFSLGAAVSNIVNDVWAENGLVVTNIGDQICNELHDTDGLEVYFIPGKGVTGEVLGRYSRYGIILRNAANSNTLAHEIGHACGWYDIYRGSDIHTTHDSLMANVKEVWMPDDWNNGTGCRFYDHTLLQSDLILRLLMYGYGSDTKCDIPNGGVRGMLKSGALGQVGVGSGTFMTTTPRSL